jgi:hypothetical protein
MAAIKRFEDIQAWQRAREFTSMIYQATANGLFAKDYCSKDQTKRAAISIMLNIAEGFGRKTDKEFNQFLVQAHGSLRRSAVGTLYRPRPILHLRREIQGTLRYGGRNIPYGDGSPQLPYEEKISPQSFDMLVSPGFPSHQTLYTL